jgi:hypothetical protein
VTLHRQRPPSSESIPSESVASALAAYEQATVLSRDSAREHEQLVRQGRQARADDRAATVAALDRGEPAPPPVHQRELDEKIETAERTRDARLEIANRRWSEFEAEWNAHRGEMLAAIQKDEARDIKEHEKVLARLEEVTLRRAARANLRTALDDPVARSELLVIQASLLPIQDHGVYRLEHVVQALRQIGLPEPPKPTLGPPPPEPGAPAVLQAG